MKNKETQKLLEILNDIKNKNNLGSYIDVFTYEEDNISLSDYILKVARSKGFNKSDIIKNADIYRTYGYEILSGKKIPGREKLLQICIGNDFSLEETNKILTLAKLGILYAKDPKDSIIIYALNNNLDLIETNILLSEHSFNPLI